MDNQSGDVITWNGKLLAPVTSDHAFRVRMDVQLYYMFGEEMQTESSPEHFRRHYGAEGTTIFWTGYQYYIEVDPPKPEYTSDET